MRGCEIMDAETIIRISQIISALAIIGALSINYYKVKVHHRVLFGERGELNFVTIAQKKELDDAINTKITENNIEKDINRLLVL
jgi:hypothetical protein